MTVINKLFHKLREPRVERYRNNVEIEPLEDKETGSNINYILESIIKLVIPLMLMLFTFTIIWPMLTEALDDFSNPTPTEEQAPED